VVKSQRKIAILSIAVTSKNVTASKRCKEVHLSRVTVVSARIF